MAAAAPDNLYPLKRSSSYEQLPPNMSELRVVLLGNSWSQRGSVGNFILGTSVFNTEEEPDHCQRVRGRVKEKEIVLINTPDLLHPNIPQNKLTEHEETCVSYSKPGPHVFLLVLQPEDFSEEHKLRLQSILENFSDRSFDHSLVLVSTPREESPGLMEKYMEDPQIEDLIRMCRYRFLWQKNLEHSEMLTRLGQIVKENNGDHVSCDVFEDTTSSLPADHQSPKQKKTQTSILSGFTAAGPDEEQSREGLRIVLIGKNGSGKSSSGNTILGRDEFKADLSHRPATKRCQREQTVVNGRPVVVVNTAGLFDTTLSHEEVNEEMVKCISLLAPGPHVFLLVIPIGRFTPEEKETLKLIQEGFGKNAERFTIILLTGGDKLEHYGLSIDDYIKNKCDDSFKKLIADCGGRYHVFDNHDKQNHMQVSELITKIDTMVKTNGGSCYTNEMLQEAEVAIQKEMERILKEKEEELRREREELKRKHQKEVKGMKRRMRKQREEIEKERKLREKQLKEMEENINREREDRKKEQEMREEEDRKRKQEEEIQKQEWKQKVEALERKIRSESESKENIEKKLKESREEMWRERENWEKKLKEWWDKRREEDEQRRQEEETRLRKLQEEYDQEKENDEKKRKQEEKEKKDMEEKLRAEIEKERNLREKQLKEKEENINREREERKKEQKMRKEKDSKRKQEEEIQKQEWKQRVQALEQKIRSESESKENIQRKLEEIREETRRERENWETKQKEWWEKRLQENEHRRQEEETRLRKLQEEYEQEKENDEKKRKEEDRMRREQEEKEKKVMEEKFKQKMENLKKRYDEEAREKAEEFRELKEKYNKKFEDQKKEHGKQMKEKDEKYDRLEALKNHNEEEMRKKEEMKEKHLSQLSDLVKCATKRRANLKQIDDLLKNQEENIKWVKTKEGKKELQEQHEKQMNELIQELLSEDNSWWSWTMSWFGFD